jgi:arginine N-succinyltransferase
MMYSVRPARDGDGTTRFPVDLPGWYAVVNLSDHPCLLFRMELGIGAQSPRHWFRLGQVVHSSRELKIHTVRTTLVLGNDLTGASELTLAPIPGTEASLPEAVRAMAQHVKQHLRATAPAAFTLPICIAPLPGVVDSLGRSPFWDALGHHFCGPWQPVAQRSLHWQEKVASLMPRHPIYASFLGAAGEAAIGAVAIDSKRLEQALLTAGFRRGNYIDIVDGGPVLEWV